MHNYLLYYCVILPLSILPFWILYGISDFAFVILYHVVGYRKAVVRKNIENSFPDKSTKEHRRIERKFYRHLTDIIVESLKMFSISEKQVAKRMTCTNPELPNSFFDQNRSIMVCGGHYNSWEYFAVAAPLILKHRPVAIYKTLKNKFFDEVVRKSRTSTGIEMVSTKLIKESMLKHRENNTLTATIFATDQSPTSSKRAYWTNFLNQDTAVLFGTESYARQFNAPVLFAFNKKVKRGHYELTWELVSDQSKETKVGEITEKHTRLLEKQIQAEPEFWLWSHKRWKRKRDE